MADQTENTTTTELALASSAELEAAAAAILDGKELPGGGGDPEAVSRMILERILASDPADLFKPQNLEPWRESIDRPAEVSGFHLNRSSFEGGSSVYAIVDLTWLDDGESESVTCGGRNVMAQLLAAMRHGLLPVRVKLVGNRTAEGYQALWLEAV
jgi:hypothetical protein